MLRQPAWRALRGASSINNTLSVSARLFITRTYATSRKPPPAAAYKLPPKTPTSTPRSIPTQPNIRKAAASPVTSASGIENQPSPIQGTRPQVGKSEESPLSGNTQQPAQEPIAQQADLDTPPSKGIRNQAQQAQSFGENTPAPGAATSAPTSPQQPLPDLRQGIPSTFDFEFGQGRRKTSSENASLDITEQEAESTGRRGSEEDDYNRSDFQTSIDRRRAAQLRYTYALVVGAIVFGGLYFTRPFGASEGVPNGLDSADLEGWEPGKMYRRVRARIGDRVGYYTEPSFEKLLPDVPLTQRPPFTLVLSLEDLMVHTAWDRTHGYRMAKRPGIDYFIRYLSPYYELVLFTSVPISIADPVIKKLDPYHFIMWPLGREATKYEGGDFVKDLSYLNRDLKKTLIIDTVAGHVKNQPDNAIVLPKWTGDAKDANTNDLVALIPFLEYIATMSIDDVREVIKSFEGKHIPTEFARREAIAREQFNKQLAEERAKRPKRSLGAVFGGGLGIKADRAGSMMLGDGQTVAEGLAQGKMLSDQIREQGQKQYEFLEKQIREQGAQWLKDEEEEQKRLMDEQMKEMKKNPVGTLARWFGGEPPKKE